MTTPEFDEDASIRELFESLEPPVNSVDGVIVRVLDGVERNHGGHDFGYRPQFPIALTALVLAKTIKPEVLGQDKTEKTFGILARSLFTKHRAGETRIYHPHTNSGPAQIGKTGLWTPKFENRMSTERGVMLLFLDTIDDYASRPPFALLAEEKLQWKCIGHNAITHLSNPEIDVFRSDTDQDQT